MFFRFNRTRKKRWLFGIFIIFVFTGSICFSYLKDNGKLKVVFFDVGQGDATLIRTPSGEDILIDGGPSSRVVQKIGKYLPFFDKDIELIVLTHPHADHITGLIEVLKRYNVKKVLTTDLKNSTAFFDEWEKYIKEEKGAEIELADIEDKFVFGEAILKVLWPKIEHQEHNRIENFSEFLNDSSIVNELIYGAHKFLFTGDITCDTEKEIIAQLENFNQNNGTQVLKVPHHGSKYSSAEEFLEILNPDIAVVSVGENNHGLPSLRIIRRLERFAKQIFRTDEDGDVVFVCDKEECEINP